MINGISGLKDNGPLWGDYALINVAQDAAGNVVGLYDMYLRTKWREYEYDGFGRMVAERKYGGSAHLDKVPLRHATRILDPETGLQAYHYRLYSPWLGRWLSRDPIGEAGGLNLYGMVGNNPVNAVDPLGLDLINNSGGWGGLDGYSQIPGGQVYSSGIGTLIANGVEDLFAPSMVAMRARMAEAQARIAMMEQQARRIADAMIAHKQACDSNVYSALAADGDFSPWDMARFVMIRAFGGFGLVRTMEGFGGSDLAGEELDFVDRIGRVSSGMLEVALSAYGAEQMLKAPFSCSLECKTGPGQASSLRSGAAFSYEYQYVNPKGNPTSWWRFGHLKTQNPKIQIFDLSASPSALQQYLAHERFHEFVYKLSPQLSQLKQVPFAGGYFRVGEESGAYLFEAIVSRRYLDILRLPSNVWRSANPLLTISQKIGLGAGAAAGATRITIDPEN
ncbi:MAG: RHS repeat-associated core domain-containing protein [Kiritimatiellia bacterium]